MSALDQIITWASDGDRHLFDVVLHGPASADLLRDAVMIHPDGTVTLA